MAYTKTTWVDEVPAETPVKYKITDDTGGVIAASATIETVTSITAGTALTAANLNNIEEGLEAVTKTYPVLAVRNGTTSLPIDTSNHLVVLDTEIYDDDGVFADNKYTAPVNGYYLVEGAIQVNHWWGAGYSAHLNLYKNGSHFCNLAIEYFQYESGAARNASFGGSIIIYLSAGDYISFYIYINGGGAARTYTGSTLNKQTRMSVVRVG